MNGMSWPSITMSSKSKLLGKLFVSGLFSRQFLRYFGSYCAFVLCYYLLMRSFTIPGANIERSKEVLSQWWYLEFVDIWFTGGALKLCSLLSPGAFSVFVSYGVFRATNTFKYRMISLFEFFWLFVVSIVFVTWFVSVGILTFRFPDFVFYAIMVFLSALFIRYFFCILLAKLDLGHYAIFPVVLCVNLLLKDGVFNFVLAVGIVVSVLPMSIVYAYIYNAHKEVPLVHYNNHLCKKFMYSFRVVDGSLVYSLLSVTLLLSSTLTAICSVFFPLDGNELRVVFCVFSFSVLCICFLCKRILAGMLSSFNPSSLTRFMKRNHYVLENTFPGEDTCVKLNGYAEQRVLNSYFIAMLFLVVSLVVYAVMCSSVVMFQESIPIYAFQFIYFNFVHILFWLYVYAVGAGLGSQGHNARKSLEFVNIRTESSMEDYETGKFNSTIIDVLPQLFPADKQEEVGLKLACCKNKKDVFKVLIYYSLIVHDVSGLSLCKLLLRLLSIIFSCFFVMALGVCLVVFVSKLFYPAFTLNDFSEGRLIAYGQWFAGAWGTFATFSVRWFSPDLMKSIYIKLRQAASAWL